jgi:tRNA(Ile2) C34 agmatinyltransferase TiaS
MKKKQPTKYRCPKCLHYLYSTGDDFGGFFCRNCFTTVIIIEDEALKYIASTQNGEQIVGDALPYDD